MEGWKDGWKDGRVEGWMDLMERWKDGRMEDVVLSIGDYSMN